MTVSIGATRVRLSDFCIEQLVHVETFFMERGQGDTFSVLNLESLKYFIENERMTPEAIFRAVGCKLRAEAQA